MASTSHLSKDNTTHFCNVYMSKYMKFAFIQWTEHACSSWFGNKWKETDCLTESVKSSYNGICFDDVFFTHEI